MCLILQMHKKPGVLISLKLQAYAHLPGSKLHLIEWNLFLNRQSYDWAASVTMTLMNKTEGNENSVLRMNMKSL